MATLGQLTKIEPSSLSFVLAIVGFLFYLSTFPTVLVSQNIKKHHETLKPRYTTCKGSVEL